MDETASAHELTHYTGLTGLKPQNQPKLQQISEFLGDRSYSPHSYTTID